ncbi:response regulator [Maridesulfovibrio bastinii]|uniref:response regulator n=1 Tax=Maridesulfovibrio bastinii TaxID=47157 RepID=UPI00041214A5|nr:response regulator [Maridesulfovibrio bastinii]
MRNLYINHQGTNSDFYLFLSTQSNLGSSENKLTSSKEANLPPQNGIRVLVVEDNRINLLAITRYLYKKGYSITGVPDGRKAVEAVLENQFDCIVMDIQMPVMDGLTATSTIRSSGSGATEPEVPIIAITAYALPGDRERFLRSGMDDYLPKPLDFDALERTIIKHHQK